MTNEIIELINSVGFPITVSVAFFFICINMFKAQQKLLTEFQNILRDNTEIIKDNTETTKVLLQELRYQKVIHEREIKNDTSI